MNLNRDETVEKISAEFDQRLWKTANDDIQLRMFSQYEAEAVRAALSASHEGHDAPCYYCKEPCDSLAGNPGRWPIPLCHRDEPGVVKWHHTGCVAERLIENQPAHSTNSDLLTPERIEEFRREYKIPPFDNNGQPMEDWASEENKVLDALCDAALSSLSAERCRFCGKPYSEPSASPNHPMGCRDDHAPASSERTPNFMHESGVPYDAYCQQLEAELAALRAPTGDAIPQEIQEWLWHMDTHLTEHDVRHAGLALRAAWPAVRDHFARIRGELIQLRNRKAPNSATSAQLDGQGFPATWNAAIERCATLADEEWVGQNSLGGSKLARRIADRIRDLKILSKNEVVARSEGAAK